jgi:MFS family permease
MFDRFVTSAVAVGATLLVGMMVYVGWALLSVYLSLHRQTERTESSITAAIQGLVLGGGLLLLVVCVRIIVGFKRRGTVVGGRATAIAVGAVIGVLGGLFLNENLRLSPWRHLLVDVPDTSGGRFWLIVPSLGLACALLGSMARDVRRL